MYARMTRKTIAKRVNTKSLMKAREQQKDETYERRYFFFSAAFILTFPFISAYRQHKQFLLVSLVSLLHKHKVEQYIVIASRIFRHQVFA